MKILHFADLHLDSPFVGIAKEFPSIQSFMVNSAYKAFANGVSVAINRHVDAVVIVGDVFDAEKQTVYAQHFFQQQLERLNQAAIPVIFSYGNHDYMTPALAQRQYSDNVHVFRSDKVEGYDLTLANGEVVRFYGFSYKTKWVKDRMIQQYPVNAHETTYTIGLLHGEMASQSQNAQEGHYAPFTVKELLDKEYDYWALGHIHVAQSLNNQPPIQYAGTIQGRHRHEVGPKGAYLVEIRSNRETQLEFIPLASILWQPVVIECQYQMQASDLVQKVQEALTNYYHDGQAMEVSYILDIELTHAERLDTDLQEQITHGELMDSVSMYTQSQTFAIIGGIRMHRQIQVTPFEYDRGLHQSFVNAYTHLQDPTVFRNILEPLMNHPTVHAYLQDILQSETTREELLKGGYDLVVQSLGFEEEEVTHEN